MILDQGNEVPAHINVYVNRQEIHSLDGANTVVNDGDELAVIPAIAGGEAAYQALTPDQVTRYSRHIIMPQIGPMANAS